MHQFPKFTQTWNCTCFGQFLFPPSGIYSLYTRHWYMSYRFVDSFRAGPGWNISLMQQLTVILGSTGKFLKLRRRHPNVMGRMRAVKYLLAVHMGFGNIYIYIYRTLNFVTILPRHTFLGLCFNVFSIFNRLYIKVDAVWIHVSIYLSVGGISFTIYHRRCY